MTPELMFKLITLKTAFDNLIYIIENHNMIQSGHIKRDFSPLYLL